MPRISNCGAPKHECSDGQVADRINDFLDAKTNGEDLLHALYDHVLDEPIPERIRALFRAAGETGM